LVYQEVVSAFLFSQLAIDRQLNAPSHGLFSLRFSLIETSPPPSLSESRLYLVSGGQIVCPEATQLVALSQIPDPPSPHTRKEVLFILFNSAAVSGQLVS
jgi:hypothetical protein